ncbi:MAG: redoxin domain-containing protein [Hydrogenophilales bacterium]|nr:redoxin domain-containing protein [Hydrogenophilales bacterium]
MEPGTRLAAGDVAPAFSSAVLGREHGISLEQYRGRHVLLSFYRYASCPLCNLRVHDLAQRHAAWQTQGLDMLAVFQSPADALLKYVGAREPPFPLLPDPEQRLYALYGVGHSWAGFAAAWLTRLPEITRSVVGKGYLPGGVQGGIHRIPADFLIAPDGLIAEAYYGRDIGDHLPLQRIERHVRQLG